MFVFFSLITEEIAADVIACLVFHLAPRRNLGAISFDSISQTALTKVFGVYNQTIRELSVLISITGEKFVCVWPEIHWRSLIEKLTQHKIPMSLRFMIYRKQTLGTEQFNFSVSHTGKLGPREERVRKRSDLGWSLMASLAFPSIISCSISTFIVSSHPRDKDRKNRAPSILGEAGLTHQRLRAAVPTPMMAATWTELLFHSNPVLPHSLERSIS